MRIAAFGLAVIVAGGATLALSASARAQTCDELWYERNAIYKRAGYCFKTERAIRTFGNEGCEYDNAADLPLSRRDRARIARIVRLERELGCPR